MAPYSEKLSLAFLKDMGLEIENILKQAESVNLVVERLHRDYVQFVEDNPDIGYLEAFKNIEIEIRNLCRTCKFISRDCMDIRHSIARGGAEVMSIEQTYEGSTMNSKHAELEKQFTNNRFTFTGVFVEFKPKQNGYGEPLLGFMLRDITEVKTKKLFLKGQQFHLSNEFKDAFEKNVDEELIGKTIKFNGFRSTQKKGYFEYRDNVLIIVPDELEYRVLRPTKIKAINSLVTKTCACIK